MTTPTFDLTPFLGRDERQYFDRKSIVEDEGAKIHGRDRYRTPGRLLDPETQQRFEKLAPNVGETAFLPWIYKDLASTRGGVHELFGPQPTEVALASDELTRALIAFWPHPDADTGAGVELRQGALRGRVDGDLYQEFDPVVKDGFALCQTPDFVRAVILDRTLTLAIETFGAAPLKVIHNAHFECRVLAAIGIALDGVFDNLETSRRVGAFGGHSLAMVCERELGIVLDKSSQTSNWSLRPLDADQLKYAALDAEVLLALHERFKDVSVAPDNAGGGQA